MAISVSPGPDGIWIDGTPVSKAQVRAILDDIIADANATFSATDKNIGKIFETREAAVAVGQAGLPGTYARIVTIEGTAIVIRGLGQQADDPLFGTHPYWGVIQRHDLPQAIMNAGVITLENVVNTDGTITADWPQWVIDGGMDSLSPATTIGIQVSGAANSGPVTLSISGGPANPVNNDSGAALTGGEIGLNHFYQLKWYPGPQQWRVILGLDVTAGLKQRVDNLEEGVTEFGFTELKNIGGTGDAITAEWPEELTYNTLNTPIGFRYVPIATNTAADPVIEITNSVVGSQSKTLKDVNGDPLPPGFFKTDNRAYLFRTAGAQDARLVSSDPVSIAEANAYRQGDLLLDGSQRLVGLETPEAEYLGDLIRIYPDGLALRLRGGSSGSDLPSLDGWAVADGRYTAQAGQHGIMAVDRFEVDSSNPRKPIPEINGVARKAVILSLYGQSNASQQPTGDPLLYDSPGMPYHTLMLNDVSGNGNRGGLKGWGGIAPTISATGLIPAVDAATGLNNHGAAAASRLNIMGPQPFRVMAVRSSAQVGTPIVGSTETQGLWKGSTGLYTQAWNNWDADITQNVNFLTADGYGDKAIFITFTHQEADNGKTRQQYLDDFLGMKADKEALLATNHPGVPVFWFADQASGSGLGGVGNGGAWPDRMSIVDAALQEANMTMVMPRYWLPFGLKPDGVTQEDIHHSNIARVWQGEVYAHAMHEIENGREWRCPWPTGATINGNDVTVDFDSLLPLVIDPTFCKVRDDMGFQLWDGVTATPATNIRLTGQRQVTMTFAVAPIAGNFVRYAYRSIDAQDVSDEWPVATGALRDAWAAPSVFTPGKTLVRAALGFELQL